MRLFIARVLIPLAFLLVGIGCAGLFVILKPGVDKAPVEEVAALVEIMEAQAVDVPARIRGTGAVTADQQVTLSPEVGGRITFVSTELLPGGRVDKGEVLLRVDPRTYEALLTQREGQVAQAELELRLEQGRQKVAEREWALLGTDQGGAEADLALRRPQLVNIEAQLKSARAALAQARLDLERTALRAPFNAVVVAESVDLGQVVGSGSQAVTLVGTDRVRVEVQLAVEQLSFVDVPGMGEAEGSLATVTQALGNGQAIVRSARVHRLVGQLEPQTRTATLVLLVDAPMQEGSLPLMPGAYVTVEIAGRAVEGAIAVPRSALWEGDTVWLVDAESRLEKRPVEVAFRGAEEVLLGAGVEHGERIVVSALSLPLPGLKVRTAADLEASVDAPPAEQEG